MYRSQTWRRTRSRPVAATHPVGASHPKILLPRDLYGVRANSTGLDLTNEARLRQLADALQRSVTRDWRAGPTATTISLPAHPVINPANHDDVVGSAIWASIDDVDTALQRASGAAAGWQVTPAAVRAQCLTRAADLNGSAQWDELLGLIVRERRQVVRQRGRRGPRGR